jgi:hypothetical protein
VKRRDAPNTGLIIPVTSSPACRKTRCARKITIIVSFKRATLTVCIYRDDNQCLSDLLSKISLCDLKYTYEFCAVNDFLHGTLERR